MYPPAPLLNEGRILPTMNTRYQQYGGSAESSNDSTSDDNEIELNFTPHTTVRTRFHRVFGTSSEYGQSYGTALEKVRLVDGALYVDPEKGKYKLFSWENVSGLSPAERYERGTEPTLDDAPDVESKTYGSTNKTYELVGARIEPVVDDDGEVLVEAKSKSRSADVSGDTPDFGEWEDNGGDVIEIGDTLTWWDGSDEYGPTTAAKRVATLTSEYGEDIIEDEDDNYNWLADVTGNDILRDDLIGREVEFFITTKTGESGFDYHYPVMLDAETGAEIAPNNAGGDSGNSDTPDSDTSSGGTSDESDEIAEAREMDAADYPEPIADFIRSGESLSMTEDRAMKLLEELIEEPDNPMTEQMVEDYGGKDALVDRVTQG